MATHASGTIQDSLTQFLEMIHSSRSDNTYRSYTNALDKFEQILADHKVQLASPIENLPDDAMVWFLDELKRYSPATEKLYITAVYRFFEFLTASNRLAVNLPRIRLLIRHRSRRYGQRLPQFPRKQIETLIEYAINIASLPSSDANSRLRLLRDRAILLSLADTGMRIHEICNLRRGDLDWNEQRAIIIGKGNQQAVVRFSARSMQAIREYLSERASLDGASGKPISSLPVFARHDKAAGKKIKPISTTTGRAIVAEHVERALGADQANVITPHSFRHYFVTTVLRGSGGNLKLAQELARHKSISVTQRYAHLSDDELDRGYDEIFNR